MSAREQLLADLQRFDITRLDAAVRPEVDALIARYREVTADEPVSVRSSANAAEVMVGQMIYGGAIAVMVLALESTDHSCAVQDALEREGEIARHALN